MPKENGRRDPVPPNALGAFGFVTPAVRSDLERLVALLREWQRTHNLVSQADLDSIWTRHVADSLQLAEHAPEGWREWVDLGSGAGFPGLVVAIAAESKNPLPLARRGSPSASAEGWVRGVEAPPPQPHPSPSPLRGQPPPHKGEGVGRAHVTLVESNLKKAAFLRAAIRETGANASVAAERIEGHGKKFGPRADVVSARALAPLPALLPLAAPYLNEGSVLLLLKGQDFVHEHEAASKAWDYDVVSIPSVTNPGGQVVAIRRLRRRV